MKIAILGSTGFVGEVLLPKAIEKGYQVKTLVRNPEKLGIYKEKVEFISGTASQADKLEQTIIGTEVVLSTLPPILNTNGTEKSGQAFEDLVAVLKKIPSSVLFTSVVRCMAAVSMKIGP